MPIFDGEPVDAAVTNAVFLDKTQNDTAVGIYVLANTAPASGATITNIQGLMNHLANTTGATVTSDGTTYSSQQRITDGDNHETALGELDSAFNGTTGHKHTGAAGDGPTLSASSISGNPLHGYFVMGTDTSVTSGNNSVDVTGQLSSQTVSTGPTVEGLPTTSPNNKAIIRQTTGVGEDSPYYDSVGNIVYGRISHSGSTWTLSFYTEISGTETAYTFASTSGIRFYYQKLFNPLSDAQVYSEVAEVFGNSIQVASFAKTGGTLRYGDISLTAGTNITITDNGNGSFTISTSGSTAGTLMQSGLVWVGDTSSAGAAAQEILEFSQDAWSFANNAGNSVFCILHVPGNYTAGTQIFLYGTFYSPSTVNDFSYETVSSLIRSGTDAVGSTTNQHTSTTATVNNTGHPANQSNRLSFDITDSLGKINGVAVSPGDTIEVQLLRISDSDTNNVRFRPSTTEVTFS